MKTLRIGLSTCPNDTFAFHHLLTADGAPSFGPVEWIQDDVQSLNERLRAGELDIAKISFGAALTLAGTVDILPVGAALGFGVGPIVLTGARDAPEPSAARVLCPGVDTTAHMLWRIFHPESRRVEQRVFSAILPALSAGEADLGVCIHEARFTYSQHGLTLWGDLGAVWEQVTGLPLPLGGIGVMRTTLGSDSKRVAAFARALRESIVRARAEPAACLPTMRRYAQEFSDDVLLEHARTYVNDWTLDLGLEGRAALHELWARARAAGLTQHDAPPRVLEHS